MAQLDLGNGYSIDFDDAQQFINALQTTLHNLQATQLRARKELYVYPPGNDDYSAAFAASANQMIQAHDAWNQGRQDELNALIQHATDALNNYRQTEHNNTNSMKA